MEDKELEKLWREDIESQKEVKLPNKSIHELLIKKWAPLLGDLEADANITARRLGLENPSD